MPNELFNPDIWYSEILKMSLKHEEMEKEKHCKFLFTFLSVSFHTCTMWRLYKPFKGPLLPAIISDLAVKKVYYLYHDTSVFPEMDVNLQLELLLDCTSQTVK